MKKCNSVYIDLNNKEQVKYWNTIGNKLVRVVNYTTVVETATNKPVGYLIMIKGLFKNKVMNDCAKFIEDPIRAKIEVTY